MDERWKPVPGWEKYYQVSDLGRVASRRRKIVARQSDGKLAYRIYRSKILKPGAAAKGGYKIVSFTAPKRAREYFYVHELVLLTFVGPRPSKLECCHYDGNPKNNRLRNLRYDTKKGNARDRIRHGTNKGLKGLESPSAKLSADQVRWLRENKARFSHRELGRRVGLSHTSVGAILRGESYEDVT